MAALANQFADLLERHSLASVSVSLLRCGERTFWQGTAQAIHGTERLCGMKHGETPEAALTASIAELNELRAVAVHVPQLEAA